MFHTTMDFLPDAGIQETVIHVGEHLPKTKIRCGKGHQILLDAATHRRVKQTKHALIAAGKNLLDCKTDERIAAQPVIRLQYLQF